ncbi:MULTISPECIES: DUF3188 domain-containing protein [unclassified Prochlorococcus]|uniref:DUF3188 domain-containing protein n=1 Tax=unclassified Prochlorococcus TaxID=2627481 RepID=UPI000533859C|nr:MULTISPECIES: DUF3188 domain-containing protein [unclassified Prochlorococcus]KGG14614.1 putative membrane protein [Prochlorococcus sp. MIT 0602]KGG15959.1 putative membrane protein [Prochlorococcus sp. MIT 0603]
MKSYKNLLISFAAPLLIMVAILGFFSRKDNDRVQSIPAFCVGMGLIISNSVSRNLRRKTLLDGIRGKNNRLNQ